MYRDVTLTLELQLSPSRSLLCWETLGWLLVKDETDREVEAEETLELELEEG